ncbi:methyl-accepting chemotaxis sensory transducer [Rippkaea orientalis PCC 8801]|uniref:Methyl-accepting chemotaxis sensory transducer n=1 Tax=Rippkaea orientalis (strain PCC 8801 / RF-1) TaxID=41431 RepID=B7JYH4_RIPO1|nr:methyl-accepting chemotaxis protein [Rippkaea orientalis]ACK64844.1 methyl-accepting chemotaxis sensory transducer [Rippkaea orientalis PCC 8801]
MWQTLKLRNRILLGYAIPVMAFLAASIYGTLAVNQVRETFKEMERVNKILEKSHTMESASSAMVSSIRGYIATQNPAFFENYNFQKERLTEALTFLNTKDIIRLETQKEKLKKIATMNYNYEKQSEKIIAQIKSGKTAEALKLMQTNSKDNLDQTIQKLTKEFDQVEQELLEKNMQQAQSALDRLFMMLGICLILAILATILGVLIANGISKSINESAQVIITASSQIASTVEEQERTASLQAASVNETTTTMDELGASSRQSTEQADSAANTAQEVLKLTEKGNDAVQETLIGMEDLQEKVAAIAKQTVNLSGQTNQIGNISQVVTDLARQTNMLALNAAVEAVRAGEQGKGFSVVASEIRKLADQSKQSAERINLLVSEIQNAINVTVMVTDEGTKTVKAEMEIAQQTAQTFAQVAQAISDVVINNQQISLNIRQQDKAVQQVLEAMNSINQGAQESAAGLNQTKIGIRRLNEASKELLSLS